MKNQKGFTLIELLLVLAIIGIISAIAIPALLGQREAARNKATASNCANVRAALVLAIDALDMPDAQRPTDIVGLTLAQEAVDAVALRPEYALADARSARNPFNKALAAYTYAAVVPDTFGNACISNVALENGKPAVALGYGIRVSGVADLTPRVSSIDASQ